MRWDSFVTYDSRMNVIPLMQLLDPSHASSFRVSHHPTFRSSGRKPELCADFTSDEWAASIGKVITPALVCNKFSQMGHFKHTFNAFTTGFPPLRELLCRFPYPFLATTKIILETAHVALSLNSRTSLEDSRLSLTAWNYISVFDSGQRFPLQLLWGVGCGLAGSCCFMLYRSRKDPLPGLTSVRAFLLNLPGV